MVLGVNGGLESHSDACRHGPDDSVLKYKLG